MLPRGYVEVLFKTADTPLGQELDQAMQRYDGVHLVAFSVADAAKAHRRLTSSVFACAPMSTMERPVDTPDGPGKAAFSLARLSPGEMAEGRIQILTHLTESTVWQRRWLVIRNGALALASVMIVVSDPDEAAERFSRFTNRPARSSALGKVIELDRGRIDLVRSDAFTQIVTEIYVPTLPFIGAYTIIVRSLATVERFFVEVRSADATRRPDPDRAFSGRTRPRRLDVRAGRLRLRRWLLSAVKRNICLRAA